MKIKIWKDVNRTEQFICELKDEEYPYRDVVAYGKTDYQAESNAWKLWRKIIEEQLSTKPKMIINDPSLLSQEGESKEVE